MNLFPPSSRKILFYFAIYLVWGTETQIQFCTYILRYRYLGVPKHFEKYETISGKPFTSIIRKWLLFVLCREHPKVLARDKLSTFFSNDNLWFCICVKCVCKVLCVYDMYYFRTRTSNVCVRVDIRVPKVTRMHLSHTNCKSSVCKTRKAKTRRF